MADYTERIRRVFRSAKYGIQQAISSYNAENFVPEIEYSWDTQPARMARYWHNRNYAYNTVYSTVNRYADTFKFKEKLYRHIKGIYNPVWRLVNLEASKVLGGAINYETFKDGAIAINGADERLLEAVRTVYQWSNMDLLKTIYVREGATMGDSLLKVVDEPEKQKVRIEYLDPRKVVDVDFDSVGNIKYIEICYEKEDPITGQWYEYRECIDTEYFRTYRNGAPYDYQDMSASGQWEWENPYGFVPVRWVQHINVGLNSGATSYHASRHKIDQLNDALSLVLNNVRMQVNTKFSVSKVNVPRTNGTPSTLSITAEREDQAPFIEIGEGEIKPIVFPVNVEGAMMLADRQMKEIQADLPQLALQNMRGEAGNLSGVSIENLYSDAHDIIAELQANYLFGLRAVTQMAISIGAYRRYPQFTSYSLESYERGNLDFDIRPKPLFQDKLNLKDTLTFTMQAAKSEAANLVLEKLGYDEEEIQEMALARDERDRQNVRAAFSDLMSLDSEAQAVQRLSDEDEDESEYAEMPNRAMM